MPSWRGRESQKQARSRQDNESTAHARAVSSGHGPAGRSFACECGDEHCTRAISLTLAEYEAVRAHATRFVVAPNHENPESERVVDENKRFAVVEEVTADEVRRARETDPRRSSQAAAESGRASATRPGVRR